MINTRLCVCVQTATEKSVTRTGKTAKPQEGGLCLCSHARFGAFLPLCCCCVASQSASSVVGATPESTSKVLALLGWS